MEKKRVKEVHKSLMKIDSMEVYDFFFHPLLVSGQKPCGGLLQIASMMKLNKELPTLYLTSLN